MKILLIHSGDQRKMQGRLTFAKSPPLGLLYLGGILEQDGHKVEILDYYMEDLSREKLKNSLLSSDVVGIDVYTYALKSIQDVSKLVKELDPDIPIIVGGPHCIFNQKKSLADFPEVNISAVGEGEPIVLDLVKYLQGKKKPSDIHGIYYRNNGSIKSGKPLKIIEDLDSIPFPARYLVEKYEYGELPFGYRMKKMTTMITSRGCPFKCRFCSRYDSIIPDFKFRQRSAENILQEIEEISEKYLSISIVDDNFLVDTKRAHKIFDEIIKKRLDIELGIHGARVDTADRKLYLKMKKAGVKYLYFGLESANQDVLDFYNKKTNIFQIKKAIKLSREMNFVTTGNFIIGAPIETKEHIERTIKLACSLPLDIAGFGPLLYIRGSELWNEAVENKNISKDRHVVLAGSENGLGKLTQKEIINFAYNGYKRFYLRPKYIFGQIYRSMLRNDYSLLFNGMRYLSMLKGITNT